MVAGGRRPSALETIKRRMSIWTRCSGCWTETRVVWRFLRINKLTLNKTSIQKCLSNVQPKMLNQQCRTNNAEITTKNAKEKKCTKTRNMMRGKTLIQSMLTRKYLRRFMVLLHSTINKIEIILNLICEVRGETSQVLNRIKIW